MAVTGKKPENRYSVRLVKEPNFPISIDVCGEFYLYIENTLKNCNFEQAERMEGKSKSTGIHRRIPSLDEWRLVAEHIEEIENILMSDVYKAGVHSTSGTLIGKRFWAVDEKGKCCCFMFKMDRTYLILEQSPVFMATLREVFVVEN